MTTEEKRIAIAQACGWVRWSKIYRGRSEHGWKKEGHPFLLTPPDYLNDLNAMHEAERTLSADNKTQDQWWEWLKTVCSRDCAGSCTYAAAHATAAQRADAFLLTLNLMKP